MVCAAVLGLLLSGCSTLPDTGDVHTRPAGSEETTTEAPYFAPPGPSEGDGQESIVRGFLLAMQANPPSTAVARSFLSNRAKTSWKPSQGTIVYDAATVETTGTQVTAGLRGAHRLSPQGSWLDGTTSTTIDVPLTLVLESGQWRIDNPPNALAVPASYFSDQFVPFNLYYFDRTGTVLVPAKVYVPRGEETATNLVRGLLAGAPPAQQGVAVSAFPAQADLDFAVVVNDAGIAEVPLGPEVLRLAPADLSRMVVQLAWTLRQVPGIDRLRITADGAPVTLADGRPDVSVVEGADYDPLVSTRRELLAISAGRVVREDGDPGIPVGGPFGQAGFALRSLAWNARDNLLAAVSDNGRRVFVAPERGARSASRVRAVYDEGTDVLRPAYDRFGGLWLVDNTPGGAVVHLLEDGSDRVVRVVGVTGRRISAFTVTRDGSAFVAALATGTNPTVEVSNLVRDPAGRVRRAEPARTVQVSGVDLGPARDLAQNSATSVVLLTRPAAGPDQIVNVELDGSPGSPVVDGSVVPDTVPGDLLALVATPDPALPLAVISVDRRLYALPEAGRWRASLTGVVAAAYAQ
jgi:hypothetical protein